MSYNCQTERAYIFTDEGQKMFLKIRDAAHDLLKIAGAFRQGELLHRAGIGGDSFSLIACVDRLVELGEIVYIPGDQQLLKTSRLEVSPTSCLPTPNLHPLPIAAAH